MIGSIKYYVQGYLLHGFSLYICTVSELENDRSYIKSTFLAIKIFFFEKFKNICFSNIYFYRLIFCAASIWINHIVNPSWHGLHQNSQILNIIHSLGQQLRDLLGQKCLKNDLETWNFKHRLLIRSISHKIKKQVTSKDVSLLFLGFLISSIHCLISLTKLYKWHFLFLIK